ncbi:uncharacterized protein [Procambarus clarkii]|uniref:uncharacterized protein n=1 Tax=Procambarus clarkii TaxID=6728 RepID=UPI003743E437
MSTPTPLANVPNVFRSVASAQLITITPSASQKHYAVCFAKAIIRQTPYVVLIDKTPSKTWRNPHLLPEPVPLKQQANQRPPPLQVSTPKPPFSQSFWEEVPLLLPANGKPAPKQHPATHRASRTNQPLYSTVQALTSAASMIAGNNPQEYVRILNILYKANGLPASIVPEEVFTNTTASSQDTVSVPDITVNAAVLTDLLSTAAKPAPPATSSQATQTPTPPLSTTATVPPLVCEPCQRPKPAAGPIKPQQARTHYSRFTASTSESADSSDEDVLVGTPSPPLQHPYTTEDFRLEVTSNDSLTVSMRSKTNKQARRPGKKKNADDLRPSKSRNQ